MREFFGSLFPEITELKVWPADEVIDKCILELLKTAH